MFTFRLSCVEFAMCENQSNAAWRAQQLAGHPALCTGKSTTASRRRIFHRSGDSRRDFLQPAIGHIAAADVATPAGSASIGQIKEKYGGLRLYRDGRDAFPRKPAPRSTGDGHGHTHETYDRMVAGASGDKPGGLWSPKQLTWDNLDIRASSLRSDHRLLKRATNHAKGKA
jgi:hypothetical protein